MDIKGTVENIIFRNAENGYSVIDIDCGGEPVTCVGYFPPISEGQSLTLSGEYKINPRFGQQFEVSCARLNTPDTEDAIIRYLASGLIKGVGPKTALAIVSQFGAQTMDIIENDHKKLSKIKGISPKKAQEIHKGFGELKKMQDAIMFLQGYDIPLGLCMKIYSSYGKKTYDTVSSNPYKLVEDIDGVGFVKADRIAFKLGIEEQSPFRIRAGLIHILSESADKNGNTCLPKELLIEGAQKLLGFWDAQKFLDALDDMIIGQQLKAYQSGQTTMIMLSKLYFTEKSIAAKIITLLNSANGIKDDLKKEIKHFERLNNIEFHQRQILAIENAINEGVVIITGGPGTGKTTIIKCILSLYKARELKVCLAAPTGRAAKRLSESTGAEAATIHRMLEMDFNTGRFNYNETNPLDADVVIVDEVSMVDVYLMNSLLKAIRAGSRLVLVGDKDQLPSVGAGNLLKDLLDCSLISVNELKYIYRQSEESLIIANAHRINNGQMPVLDDNSSDFFFSRKNDMQEILDTVIEMATQRIPNYLNIEPKKIQVLSAMKNGVAGVDNLNRTLQHILNPNSADKRFIEMGSEGKKTRFYRGDKVMQTVNNYQMEWQRGTEEGVGVYNGDLGYIVWLDNVSTCVKVEFEDGRQADYNFETIGQLTLAYAITIHKSQGCEFDVMILALTFGSPAMMTRNLLYTALTRAKRMAVLVGSPYNIKRMTENNYTTKRHSILKDLLLGSAADFQKLYAD